MNHHGPDTFWLAFLATITGCWLVRVAGGFLAGLDLRISKRS